MKKISQSDKDAIDQAYKDRENFEIVDDNGIARTQIILKMPPSEPCLFSCCNYCDSVSIKNTINDVLKFLKENQVDTKIINLLKDKYKNTK